MQPKQIRLDDKGVEQNKAFLKALYETEDLVGAIKWFDRLCCSESFSRQVDEDMTLETYLSLMADASFVVLQIGSPVSNEIKYCVSGFDDQRIDRFAWMECPLTKHNYAVVSRLFNEVFEQEITEE